MTVALQINGIDASTLGLTLAEAPGWLDMPPRDIPTAPIIGRGGLKALADPVEGARQITLTSTSRSATATLTRTQIDSIKLALSANPLSLIFSDHSDRHVYAYLKSFTVRMLQGASGPFVQEALGVDVVLSALDPLSYDNALANPVASSSGGSSSDALWYAPGATLPAETFSRTTTKNYFDANGVLQSAAIDQRADAHYIGGVRTALLERGTTNSVVSPRDLTNAAWVKTNCTPLKDQIGIDGVANSASKLTASAANATCLQAIVLGSTLRNQSAFVKRITGSGVINMTMDNGATWTAVTVTAGWTRVPIPNQTLANPTVGFRIVTSGDVVAFDYVQNENTTDPTSPFIGSRASEAGSMPWTVPPSTPLTIYAKYIELTTDTAQRRLVGIGNNEPQSTLIFYTTSTPNLYHHNGSIAVSSVVAVTPVVGDVMEVRGVYLASGAVYIAASKNGAAEVVGSTSSGLTPAAAWSALTLRFPLSVEVGLIALKIVQGERTLAEMRSLTRVPMGTGPVRPLVTILGASTNPVITLHNRFGVPVTSVSLTITTVGGDVLAIDMDSKTIKKNGVSVISAISAGDFFSIDPADQANYGGAGPFISSSSGAITVASYRTWR